MHDNIPSDFLIHRQQRQLDRETRKRQKQKEENEDPENEKTPKIKKQTIFLNNLKYTKKEWKLILLNQFFSFIPLYVHIREPIIESTFLDAAANQNFELFKEYIIEYLFIKLILICLSPISTYISFTLDQRLTQGLKEELFSHILQQDFEFFEKYNSGELINITNRNINQIKRQATGQGIINPFRDVIKGASSLWVLFNMNSTVTIAFCAIMPLYFICDYIFHKIYFNLTKERDDQTDIRSNVTNEVIQNIMTVKSFGMEEAELKDFKNFQKQQFANAQKQNIVSSVESTIHKILDVLKPIILFYCSFDMMIQNQIQNIIKDGETVQNLSQQQQFADHQSFYREKNKNGKYITAGNMSTFMRYSKEILNFYNSIKRLHSQITLKTQEASLQKIYTVLQYQSKVKDTGNIVLQQELQNNQSSNNTDIEFENVTFTYEKNKEEVQVLKDLNFKIPHGKYVAFVGMSGAGKTTIIKLIQRFYDINSGTIKIGGHNIKNIKLSSLRKNIGFVSQQLQLFNTDIENNITYGSTQYTQEELEKACEMAGCSEFLNNKVQFPKGLKTKVGERGTKLSGGQMQRLGIARAIMKKPSILIFDEATSSLDAEKEYQVQQSIEQLVKSAKNTITIILIAHRLSTIVNCQEIFVLKDGKIAESGTHQQLLENKNDYSDLIKRQLSQQSKQNSNEEKLNQNLKSTFYQQQKQNKNIIVDISDDSENENKQLIKEKQQEPKNQIEKKNQ